MIEKNAIVSDSDSLNENEALKTLDRVAGVLSKSRRNLKSSKTDDLIGSLSDAYENRRERQVFEWEQARRARVVGL
ncbi:MAG TPA: hypothetical protein PKO33_12495 [Pyrinomonadaceae bacterium]|nr:hypothetical protein [Pyrinomonadaceae bacterium]